MTQRKFICVQSSHTPVDRLNYNEQSQYIAATTKSTRYDRLKKSIIETLKEI
jgi:hypothetical protein